MTFRRPADAPGVRPAVSHIHVLERLLTPFGFFTLVEVTIETGRTHQIRVHLQAIGHPVVGDTTYGAAATLQAEAQPTQYDLARKLRPAVRKATRPAGLPADAEPSSRPAAAPAPIAARTLTLRRNFLHAARLSLTHPRIGTPLHAEAPLPPELTRFLEQLRAETPGRA